jgi:hypothetical protein
MSEKSNSESLEAKLATMKKTADEAEKRALKGQPLFPSESVVKKNADALQEKVLKGEPLNNIDAMHQKADKLAKDILQGKS